MAPLEAAHQNIAIDAATGYLETIISSGGKAEYLEMKSRLFQKLVLEQFGICSFSAIPDDILMWSHYSDGHQGFCLEFRRSSENMLQWARPVDYPIDDEFPQVNYWCHAPNEQLAEFAKIVTTKSKHWSYEKEWRALDRQEDVGHNYSGHLTAYPDSMLKGVIFGARMRTENRRVIKKLLVGKDVNFYEARLIRNRFQIEIVSATDN